MKFEMGQFEIKKNENKKNKKTKKQKKQKNKNTTHGTQGNCTKIMRERENKKKKKNQVSTQEETHSELGSTDITTYTKSLANFVLKFAWDTFLAVH